MLNRHLPVLLPAILLAGPAFAHAGIGGISGIAHGFTHPLTGMDHVLAMVAVGLFAASLSGRAIWSVPLAFMVLMGLGGAAALAGLHVPLVEAGIAASVLALGLALAMNMRASPPAAMALVGIFALFHGFAHGAEMPASLSGAEYAAGFLTATGLLHGVGIGAGWMIARRAPFLLRALGTAFAFAGAGLLAVALQG